MKRLSATAPFLWCGLWDLFCGDASRAHSLRSFSLCDEKAGPGKGNTVAFCCGLQVPSIGKDHKKRQEQVLPFSVVRLMGLEPIRSPIRPSNVRVCLFRHNRNSNCESHYTAECGICQYQISKIQSI